MIQSIDGLLGNKGIGEAFKAQETKTSDDLFTSALASAKELLDATSQAEAASSQLTTDFITGNNEDIHGLMIAQEKASILLQFTMQVRNQTLDAYKQIMNIPV